MILVQYYMILLLTMDELCSDAFESDDVKNSDFISDSAKFDALEEAKYAEFTNSSKDRSNLYYVDEHDQPVIQGFSLIKDASNPSSLLQISIPKSNISSFNQYVAIVQDISKFVEKSEKDINHTFIAQSRSDFINIDGLHPGHHYRIIISGRRDADTKLFGEKTIVMDPVAPNFNSQNASVTSTYTNITMRALKPYKALQDTFEIEYVQLDSIKFYPKLVIRDIAEQKHIEIYLGNLNPGRDYNITVTTSMLGLKGKPWKGILTTVPYAPQNITITDKNSSCVSIAWEYINSSGVDRFIITYESKQFSNGMQSLKIYASSKKFSVDICKGIQAGQKYFFQIEAEKNKKISSAVQIDHTLKPRPPERLQVLVNYKKRKFMVLIDVASELESHVDKCQLKIISEKLESVEVHANVHAEGSKAAARKCYAYVNLKPGNRYEFYAKTISKGVSSLRISKSLAIEPAFDMSAFGFHLNESDDGLMFLWPKDEITRARLLDIWANIVGNDSLLHIRIDIQHPMEHRQEPKRYAMQPFGFKPINIHDLQSGMCYKAQIYTATESGIVSTHKLETFIRINPPSSSIVVEEVGQKSAVFLIRISPILNKEKVSDCLVRVIAVDDHDSMIYDQTMPINESSFRIEVNKLQPYKRYSISDQVRCGSNDDRCPIKSRESYSLSFETKQDRPGPVRDLKVAIMNAHTVKLSWLQPASSNGIILHYIARIYPMNDIDEDWTVKVNTVNTGVDSEVTIIIDNLIGGLSYRFMVNAVTEAGDGDGIAMTDALHAQMPISSPPKPRTTVEVLHDTIGSTSLMLQYSTEMFDTSNGLIIKCILLVDEASSRTYSYNNLTIAENRTKILTWGQARRYNAWPTYVALERSIEPLRIFSPRQFIVETVGTDNTCDNMDPATICNGALKPCTYYHFKMRIFTAPNLWTETDYSETILTKSNRSISFIIGFIIALLFFISALLISIVHILRKRKQLKSCSQAYGSSRTSTESQWMTFKMMMAERAADCLAKLGFDTQHTATSSCMSFDDEASQKNLTSSFCHRRCRSLRERTGVDQKLERLPSRPMFGVRKHVIHTVLPTANVHKSRPVLITDFAEHVRLMSADSDFRFSEEYDELKLVGCGQSYIAADLNVNRAKNRFTNILPYDHSRIELISTDDEDGSDYINASFIPGFNSRREFIAAQGPLPSTRDDFWRAVWEQKCPAIVALTKCVEKGRDKCHQYWPDNEQLSVLYVDIEVTLLNEVVFDEFVVRELRLTNIAEKSPNPRILRHFHYMAWPDFGVPENVRGLVQFVRIYRNRLPPSRMNQPTIVHCSAGVGRSGTFIALDRLLQCASSSRPLDIFGTVYEMRMERCHMVQNEQQYIFIHHCLVYVLNEESPSFILHSIPEATNEKYLVNNFSSTNCTQGFECSFKPFMSSTPIVEQQMHSQWAQQSSEIEVHQNAAFEDDEGIAESGF